MTDNRYCDFCERSNREVCVLIEGKKGALICDFCAFDVRDQAIQERQKAVVKRRADTAEQYRQQQKVPRMDRWLKAQEIIGWDEEGRGR